MAAGDKTKLFSIQEVADLVTTVNGPDGLVTKVDDLENNPAPQLIEAYSASTSYPAGYPIRRNSKLYVANTTTTGTFKSGDWDYIGRATTDDIDITGGGNTWSLVMIGGVPTMRIGDGSTTNLFEFPLGRGRMSMPNAGALATAADNDALRKVDVAATTETMTYDAATNRFSSVETPTAVATGDTDVLVGGDVPMLAGDATFDRTNNRLTQTATPTGQANEDADVLTKFDGDAMYMDKRRRWLACAFTFTTNGTKTNEYNSAGVSVTRSSEGKYDITGLPNVPVHFSVPIITNLSDGDNLVIMKNKTTTSMRLETRDSPNFQNSDTACRIQWLNLE